jgi:hypothetical protein
MDCAGGAVSRCLGAKWNHGGLATARIAILDALCFNCKRLGETNMEHALKIQPAMLPHPCASTFLRQWESLPRVQAVPAGA